jgi:hypothetical protein
MRFGIQVPMYDACSFHLLSQAYLAAEITPPDSATAIAADGSALKSPKSYRANCWENANADLAEKFWGCHSLSIKESYPLPYLHR